MKLNTEKLQLIIKAQQGLKVRPIFEAWYKTIVLSKSGILNFQKFFKLK